MKEGRWRNEKEREKNRRIGKGFFKKGSTGKWVKRKEKKRIWKYVQKQGKYGISLKGKSALFFAPIPERHGSPVEAYERHSELR